MGARFASLAGPAASSRPPAAGPTGLALDPSGRILVVADTGNDRLQRLTLTGTPRSLPARVDDALNGPGSGTVTSAPAGIVCPTACRQGFTRGSTVTLTAAPDPGHRLMLVAADAAGNRSPPASATFGIRARRAG